jgi:hypothetical protein
MNEEVIVSSRYVVARNRGVGNRAAIVCVRLDQVETFEYVANANKLVITMMSGRYINVTDERARPMYDALERQLASSDSGAIVVEPPPMPTSNGNGLNIGTQREATAAARNNEQPATRRDLMPVPPNLGAKAKLGIEAADSRGKGNDQQH